MSSLVVIDIQAFSLALSIGPYNLDLKGTNSFELTHPMETVLTFEGKFHVVVDFERKKILGIDLHLLLSVLKERNLSIYSYFVSNFPPNALVCNALTDRIKPGLMPSPFEFFVLHKLVVKLRKVSEAPIVKSVIFKL